ncbi:MFS transporter [Nocardia sp. NPDC101769]|uniref:MFS transporter n=1 Tax=Nocardia sp. NPDC101769 TaxID=3364333 RepID=UPI003812D569
MVEQRRGDGVMEPKPVRMHREGWWVVVVLFAVLGTPVSIAGAAVTLPRIGATLGSDAVGLQGVVNAFNFAFALATLGCGRLADRVGRRSVFLGGVLLVVVANLAAAAAVSLLMLDLARVVAGAGCAAVFVGATSLMSSGLRGAARARAFTALGVVLGCGLAFGPALCGLLVSLGGWRAVFVAIAVVSAASGLAGIVSRIPVGTPPETRVGGLAIVLGNRRFLGFALIPVAGAFGYVTLLTYLPVALSAIKGVPAGQAGMLMLPMTVSTVLAPLMAARLTRLFGGPARLMLIATALMAAGSVLLLLAFRPAAPAGLLVPGMLLLGCGFGLPMGMVDREAIGSVADDHSGTAAGVMNFLRLGSEAIVIAAFGAGISHVVAVVLRDGALAAQVAAGQYLRPGTYAGAFALLGSASTLCTIVALLVSWWLLRTPHPCRARYSTNDRAKQPEPNADAISGSAAAQRPARRADNTPQRAEAMRDAGHFFPRRISSIRTTASTGVGRLRQHGIPGPRRGIAIRLGKS